MGVHDPLAGCLVHGWCQRRGDRTPSEDAVRRAQDEHDRMFGILS
jgi:hypothetical protein